MGKETCKIEKCNFKIKYKHLCSSHYSYIKRHGSLNGYNNRRKQSVRDNLTDKYLNSIEYLLDYTKIGDGCWIWNGSVNSKGYGKTRSNKTTKRKYAHRLSFDLFIEKLNKDSVLDHLCETKLCVNPFHLELVTLSENFKRHSKNRNAYDYNNPINYCRWGHEWNIESLRYWGKGKNMHRVCRLCKNESRRKKINLRGLR